MSDLKEKWKILSSKREDLLKRKASIELTYEVRKQQLKNLEDECQQLGFNPETLPQDVEKLRKEVETEMADFEQNLEDVGNKISSIEKSIEMDK